jgi:hypothetical protein
MSELGVRCSHQTNTARASVPTATSTISNTFVRLENPYITQTIANPYSNAPEMSKDSPRVSVHSPSSFVRMIASIRIPNSTFIKNILCQPKLVIRKPPRNGPIDRPR